MKEIWSLDNHLVLDSLLCSAVHVKQYSEISKHPFWHLIHVKKNVHRAVMQSYWSHIYPLCGEKRVVCTWIEKFLWILFASYYSQNFDYLFLTSWLHTISWYCGTKQFCFFPEGEPKISRHKEIHITHFFFFAYHAWRCWDRRKNYCMWTKFSKFPKPLEDPGLNLVVLLLQ